MNSVYRDYIWLKSTNCPHLSDIVCVACASNTIADRIYRPAGDFSSIHFSQWNAFKRSIVSFRFVTNITFAIVEFGIQWFSVSLFYMEYGCALFNYKQRNHKFKSCLACDFFCSICVALVANFASNIGLFAAATTTTTSHHIICINSFRMLNL